MTKDDEQVVERDKNQPSKRIADPTNCPQCGSGLNRKMFRTGSTQHPGRDMLVCPRCGSRR